MCVFLSVYIDKQQNHERGIFVVSISLSESWESVGICI